MSLPRHTQVGLRCLVVAPSFSLRLGLAGGFRVAWVEHVYTTWFILRLRLYLLILYRTFFNPRRQERAGPPAFPFGWRCIGLACVRRAQRLQTQGARMLTGSCPSTPAKQARVSTEFARGAVRAPGQPRVAARDHMNNAALLAPEHTAQHDAVQE